MLAQPVRAGDERRVLGDGGWIYQRKLDGLRGVAVRNGATVELWSRNRLPFTRRFPEIVAALAAVPADDFTIDGELVAFEGPRTSFTRLQRPDADTRPLFYAFDLLHLLGSDVTELPLEDRVRLLAQALDGVGDPLRSAETLTGDPEALLAAACRSGWEGLVAKRTGSPYRAGRSPDWRKLKCSASQEVVIGGWTDPSGSRVGFGALLAGCYDEEGRLRYAGKVGTGFDDQTLRSLLRQLTARAQPTSPFVDPVPPKGAHWVRPDLVANVAFTEWTADGMMRHPRFEGLRPDKAATEVRRETPS